MLVYASGSSGVYFGELHTNFKLAKEGGYLALTRANLTVAYAYTNYPPQEPDVSYGIGVGGALHYFPVPTPGASNIVGKPIAVLLMRAEATVVSTNKFTKNLAELTRSADVLVAAAGVPGLIRGDMVKPGAVVVDVGINRVTGPDGKGLTVGDVAFEEARTVAGWISPVPGGVGPMTVAMLLRNTVDAALR
jgi:hypothetical protein